MNDLAMFFYSTVPLCFQGNTNKKSRNGDARGG